MIISHKTKIKSIKNIIATIQIRESIKRYNNKNQYYLLSQFIAQAPDSNPQFLPRFHSKFELELSSQDLDQILAASSRE
jgi:hypothetical protein